MTDTDTRPAEPAAPEVTFRSDVTVELVRSSAQDADVLFAARVSTQGEQTLWRQLDADPQRSQGPDQLPDARPPRLARSSTTR